MKSPAQVAYEAWAAYIKGELGAAIAVWADLPITIQNAWFAAVEAIQ